MVRKVTTQSVQAAPRTVQLSQSIIMSATLGRATHTPADGPLRRAPTGRVGAPG